VAQPNSPTAPHADSSRRERFYGGYTWLILKNLIGGTLILASLVAGPLVPGPGGIPLFLIGFTLISFPGKRRLTARILRGRRIAIGGRTVRFAVLGISVAMPALAIWLLGSQVEWLSTRSERPLLLFPVYLLTFLGTGLAAFAGVWLINLFICLMPRIRRHVRPWLRHHHIRLLPPRYRRRLTHEPGIGPVRLKGEILAFIRKRHIEADRRQHG
jgi:hypothetical protein